MKRSLLTLLFIFSIAYCQAQYSVNHATGRLSYHVPLISVNANGKSLDLSMTYTSKGLHKNEPFSPTGLGWKGNFSPAYISREVRGNCEDENYENGMLANPTLNHRSVAKKIQDGESDIFNLTLGEESVSFYLKNVDGQFLVNFLQPTNIKVICTKEWFFITGWTVYDAEGTVYKLVSTSNSLGRSDTENSSYLSAINTRWDVSEINKLKKDPIKIYHRQKNKLSSYSANSSIKSYPEGKYMLGLENVASNNRLSAAISNYQGTSSNMEELSGKLQSLNSRYGDITRSYSTSANLSSLTTYADTALAKIFLEKYKTDVSVLDNNRAILNSQIFDYNYYHNAALQEVKLALAEASSISPTRRSVDYFAHLNHAVSTDQFQDRIRFSEDESIYFYYVDDPYPHYKKISRIIYDNVETKKFVYFSYKESSDLLKKITILGSDNESIIAEYIFDYYEENNDTVNFFRLHAATGGFTGNYDYWGFYNNGAPTQPIYLDNYFLSEKIGAFTLFPVYNPKHVLQRAKVGLEAEVNWLDLTDNGGVYPNDPNVINQYPPFWEKFPYGQSAKALALKSVTTHWGEKIEFDYESNELFIPIIDSTFVGGGIRLKEIKVKDENNTIVDKKEFVYSFHDENNKLQSTGIFEEWGKWHNLETFYNKTYEDGLFYTGNLVFDNSNSGIFYHYVEERNFDSSLTGYKYPNSLLFNMLVDGMGATKYSGSIGDLLLAKIHYDGNGDTKAIERYSYDVFKNNIPKNREEELSLLNATFPYINAKTTNSLDSISQRKGFFRNFYDLQSISNVIAGLNNTKSELTINGTITSFNWANIYHLNNTYLGTATNDLLSSDQDLVATYTIFNNSYKHRLVKVENAIFEHMGDPEVSNLLPGLPQTRPYYFARILASNLTRIQSDQSFVYQSISSPNVKEIYSNNSISGNQTLQKNKFLDDYGLNIIEPTLLAIKNLNLRGTPLETSTYLLQNGEPQKLIKSNMMLFNNEGLPAHSLEWKSSGTSFIESSVVNNTLIYDSNYDTVATFSKYDKKGNLIEQTINNKKNTVLYSYSKKLPAIYFKNLGYEELTSYVPESEIEQFSNHIEPDTSMIENLISNVPSTVPFSSTLYNYDKLVHINVDESKRKTINGYDKTGRPSFVKDGYSNLLKSFSFNTKKTSEFLHHGQSVPQEGLRKVVFVTYILDQPFQRDTCIAQVISETGEMLDEVELSLKLPWDYIPRVDLDVSPYPNQYNNSFLRFYEGRVKFRFVFKRDIQTETKPQFFYSYHFRSEDLLPTFVNNGSSYYLETDYFDVPLYNSEISSVIALYHYPYY